MNALHLVGAGAALSVACWLVSVERSTPSPVASTPTAAADGHDVLVVQGDRQALAITAVSHKTDPWAGAPKGLSSAWRLHVLDATGARLADVPLDVRHFAVGAGEQGQGLRVEGCTVRDERIGMLVAAPTFANAARYVFVRPGPLDEPVVIGDVAANTVRTLAEGR
jgi:hypothetical protein